MSYSETIAKQFKDDPVGLLLYMNRDYFELSLDKQANAYQEYRKILRLWVEEWATD